MDAGLDGKVAIVTGASRGLGLAAAEALLSEGARVLIAARSEEDLLEVAHRWPDQVEVAVCDMLDRSAVAGLPERARKSFGRLDIVINNAGVTPASRFREQSMDAFDRLLAVNVVAVATLCQAAGGVMLDAGGGSIINIASITGLRGKARLAAYSASKGAVLRLTESIAAEWTEHGVRVNAIAPGAFETDAQSAVVDDPDLMAHRLATIPAGRMGAPRELGALVVFLASDLSRFVSGATFVIDGGEANKL